MFSRKAHRWDPLLPIWSRFFLARPKTMSGDLPEPNAYGFATRIEHFDAVEALRFGAGRAVEAVITRASNFHFEPDSLK